jgi:hypothetical protein
MDDAFDEIEQELKLLRPVAPSAALMARLEKEMAAPAEPEIVGRRRGPMMVTIAVKRWFWPLAAGLAAAGLIVAFWTAFHRVPSLPAGDPSRPAKTAATDQKTVAPVLQPVSATDYLYATVDEGLVASRDGFPARRVSYRYVDTYTWRNARTNASLKWMIPREEVRVVPVSAY